MQYTQSTLRTQYALHKMYVEGRMKVTSKIRMPGFPEDISENIIKYIIQNKLGDRTSTWECKTGDLYSEVEGKQECKCFSSNGPSSFSPVSYWDVIYFLDARRWLKDDTFILYRIPLKPTSEEWKNIKVNNTETFEDQAKQVRRPRVNWSMLNNQIREHCEKVYEGSFDDIFNPDREEDE